jgi:hypothetical protein
VSLAVSLLVGATSGVAAADQGGRWGDSPAAVVAGAPSGLDSLLSGEQIAPIGPAQGWFQPSWSGAWGSNYLGEGGWRSYGPSYGPFGPYPTPQTAAFFGATLSPLDPFTTQLLSFSQGQTGATTGLAAFSGSGSLANINRTGLAPLLGLNLNTLQTLGLGTVGTSFTGAPSFTLGGNVFGLPNTQVGGVFSLAGLLNAGVPPGFFLPGTASTVGTVFAR